MLKCILDLFALVHKCSHIPPILNLCNVRHLIVKYFYSALAISVAALSGLCPNMHHSSGLRGISLARKWNEYV
jgi:hypothetical protein